jgi:hypothetical protein
MVTTDNKRSSHGLRPVKCEARKGHSEEIPAPLSPGCIRDSKSRPEHEAALKEMAKSPYILNESLTDDIWEIRTEDPTKRNMKDVIIRFNVTLAPGVRLNGPGMAHHLQTAKILVNYGLSPSVGWCTSATSMKVFFLNLMLMLRWMGQAGIRNFSDLDHFHFDLFKRGLAGGSAAIYPTLPSIKLLLNESFPDCFRIPVYDSYGKSRIDSSRVARIVGLAHGNSLSAEESKLIYAAALKDHPGLAKTTTRKSSRRSHSSEGKNTHVTRARAFSIMEPWLRLWHLRRDLHHDPINVQAFPPTASLWSVAIQLGREVGRTKDIPQKILAHLLDQALRWMVYSDDIREMTEAFTKLVRDPDHQRLSAAEKRNTEERLLNSYIKSKPSEPGSPWSMIPAYATHWGGYRDGVEKGLDLRTLLTSLLVGACYVIIATFSARRDCEILSLQAGVVNRDSGIWMSSWIAKNVRDMRNIPIPECVAKAIETLEWLSAEAREETGDQWLFRFKELKARGGVIGLDSKRAINAFAEFVATPKLSDGTEFRLCPHQFRRAFAVLYIYRFRMPHLTALSWFLHHYDIDMTHRYITTLISGELMTVLEDAHASEDHERTLKVRLTDAGTARAALEEVGRQFVIEVLTLAESGQEPVGGAGGKALMLELDHYLAPVREMIEVSRLDSEEAARSFTTSIIKLAEGKRLTPHPSGTSYCKCTSAPADLQLASCLRRKQERAGDSEILAANGPDFAYAEPRMCINCCHGVQLPENARRLDTYIEGQRRMDTASIAPHLREVARKRASDVQAGRVRFYGEPKTDP